MRPNVKFVNVVIALSLSAGCSSSSNPAAPSDAGSTSDGAMSMGPKTSTPSSTTAAVLAKITNYKSWPTFPENMTPKQSMSHGPGAWVIAYHNDVVTQAMTSGMLPLADGALIVKENYAHQSDTIPMALTTMAKQGGAWYWIESTPGGQVIDDPQGNPLEGNVAMCTGCHTQKQSNDWIFTHAFAQTTDSGPEAAAPMMKTSAPSSATQAVFAQIANYKTWPKFAENTAPKQSMSHGPGAWVVAYHNDVVTQAVASGTLPLTNGALIVKENYANQTDTTPMALTTMAKQNGAWYWIESTPGGQVIDDPQGNPLEGNVAMCTGCHTQKMSNDWIYTHSFAQDAGAPDAATSD